MSISPLSLAEAGALQLAAAGACCRKVHTLAFLSHYLTVPSAHDACTPIDMDGVLQRRDL